MRERVVFNLMVLWILTILTTALAAGIYGSITFRARFEDMTRARVTILCDGRDSDATCTSEWIALDGREGTGPVEAFVDTSEPETTVDGFVDDDGMAYTSTAWDWRINGSMALVYFPAVCPAMLVVGLIWFRPHLRTAVRERRRWRDVFRAGMYELTMAYWVARRG